MGDLEFLNQLNEIAVIGGGRWARVIVHELQCLVPKSTTIRIHTARNIAGMSKWVAGQRYKNVFVETEFLRFNGFKTSALIVANAARDHEMAITAGFNASAAVLVEKPVTLSSGSAVRLAKIAKERGLYLASAHVFMFSRCIASFAQKLSTLESLEHIRIIWCDQRLEERYGENKTYDPSLPIYADCLPHILSIFEMLAPNLSPEFVCLNLYRGGSHLEIEVMLGAIPCSIVLKRNSDARKRIIEVLSGAKDYRCDFTVEPGAVFCGEIKAEGDLDLNWHLGPLVSQLIAFLRGASGGYRDPRLDIKYGLQSCRIIDDMSADYKEAQKLALVNSLAFERSCMNGDLRYALTELLLKNDTNGALEQEKELNRVFKECRGRSAEYITKYLSNL